MDGEIQIIQGADFVPAPEILVDLGQVFGVYRFVVGINHVSERRPVWNVEYPARAKSVPPHDMECALSAEVAKFTGLPFAEPG
jgi:hypothetical protein